MKKSMTVVTILIIVGVAIISTGILLKEFLICIVGGIAIAISPIFVEIKKKTSKKSMIDYIEKDERPILSSRKETEDVEEEERWKKLKQFFEKIIIMVIVAAGALGLVIIMLQDYFLNPTYISIESAITEGCTTLHRTGCKVDPSEIIINYDVNGDEIVGGVNDTLSNLLAAYNCTGNCIKKRCACSGY